MLTIKPVLNILFIRINNIDDPISIILHSSSENAYFIIFLHFHEELLDKRSYEELSTFTVFLVVYKSFI